MRDVARAAGVHQATVSLALRNQPGLSSATRERVRAIADQIGYRPDPAMDSFNFHRLAHQSQRSTNALALVTDASSWKAFEQRASHRELLEGIRGAAARLGFAVEPFLLGGGRLSATRLAQILRARNTGSVIIGPLSAGTESLELDWPKLSALVVETFHLQPSLDVFAPAHRVAPMIAVEELRKLGYQRPGLIVTAEEDHRLAGLVRAGFLTVAVPDAEDPVPPLILESRDSSAGIARLREWLRAQRVDAVLLPDSTWSAALTSAAEGRPPAHVALDLAGAPPEWAGIDAGWSRLGEFLVETMGIRRQGNLRGIPATPSTTFLPGAWLAGSTAPRVTRRRSG